MQGDGGAKGCSKKHPSNAQSRALRSKWRLGSQLQKLESVRREQARTKSGRLSRSKVREGQTGK